MKQPQMLYRQGSRLKWQGLDLDYVVIDAAIDGELEKYLADGWVDHPESVGKEAETVADVTDKPKRGRPPKAA
jgi:hypothetical protein